MAGKTRVTVWNEYRHEQNNKEIAKIYPQGMHHAIADYLAATGSFDGRTATLDQPDHGLTADVLAAAPNLKAIAREKLEWLNGMIEGREFMVGDRFTLADVMLYAFLEFGASVGQPLDAKLDNLQGWYTRVASRPSIETSKS